MEKVERKAADFPEVGTGGGNFTTTAAKPGSSFEDISNLNAKETAKAIRQMSSEEQSAYYDFVQSRTKKETAAKSDNKKIEQARQELGIRTKAPPKAPADMPYQKFEEREEQTVAPENDLLSKPAPLGVQERPVVPQRYPEVTAASRLAHLESELKSVDAEIESLQRRRVELKAERDRQVMESMRENIKGAKDMAEFYQVLQNADKALAARKSPNADGIRMLVEDARNGFSTESLKSVTAFLGIREKAIEMLQGETKSKLEETDKKIAETQTALKAELKKSGPGKKVELNEMLKGLRTARGTTAAKFDTLGMLARSAKERDEQKAYTLSDSGSAAETSSETDIAEGPAKKEAKPYKVMRPVAPMGGKGGGVSEKAQAAPEKKKRGNLFELLFGPRKK